MCVCACVCVFVCVCVYVCVCVNILKCTGKVVKVVAQDGTSVKAGDVIAIVESMKMEHSVTAPCDGWVSCCRPFI